MIKWTDAAKDELENHFSKIRSDIESSGADADEVVSDIRTHIDNEITSSGLELVNADDIKRILNQFGGSSFSQTKSEEKVSTNGNRAWEYAKKINRSSFVPATYFFGVFLPIVTVIVELSTRICRENFFDPLPTLGHVAAYLWVGIGTFLGLRAISKINQGTCESLKGTSWCVGISCGIAFIYTLIFLPIVPISLFAIIMMGLGLCSLSPLIALILTWRTHRKIKKASESLSFGPIVSLRKGVLVGMAIMILLEIPSSVTRIGLEMASSENASTKSKGISVLRAVGDEDILLRSCYFRSKKSIDLLGFLLNLNGPTTTDEGRNIFYQVTGKAFNTVNSPDYRRGDFMWDGNFDDDQGGAVVGGALNDLSLTHSGIDSSVDAQAALAYTEWTMIFKNSNTWAQREARTQIALPPGSVVSRLTLWINGEEREAAFASRNKTRDAYTKVVRRQRDPVLITTDGPDRIIVQCFPVPPNGGEMKIRFGYTTPLTLDNDKNALQALPKILERNFKIQQDVKHSLWLESKKALSSDLSELVKENPKEKLFALRGDISTKQLNDYKSSIFVDRSNSSDVSWSKDLMTNSTSVIRQDIKQVDSEMPINTVFVIDSSEIMDDYIDEIVKAFSSLPQGMKFSIVVADDEVYELVKQSDSSNVNVSKLLASISCVGGKDNVPALLKAWEMSSSLSDCTVVWIHSSQPIILQSAESLKNRFERRPGQIKFIDFQVDVAPNRIAEELDGVVEVSSWTRFGSVENDLNRLFEMWSGKTKIWNPIRTKTTNTPSTGSKQTSTHLARLWAFDEVVREWGKDKVKNRDSSIALAASYQLVTPITGAVVLETAQQYKEAGLEPVTPGSVPSIPEPETWMLLIVLAIFVLWILAQKKYRVQ